MNILDALFGKNRPATQGDILELRKLIMATNEQAMERLVALQDSVKAVQGRVTSAVDGIDELLELAKANQVSQAVIDKIEEVKTEVEGITTTPSDGEVG